MEQFWQERALQIPAVFAKKKILSCGARLSKLLQKVGRASGWMAKMNHFMQNIYRIIF
jgi:hypothetical protein